MVCNRTARAISRFGFSFFALLTLVLGHSSAVHAAAGRTPGAFSVSSIGSADYSIPIWVPPGPKGIQPTLSLSYDSNAPIGYVGLGWSISGLGAISRCVKTVDQDGSAAPVSLSVNDGYCLNGRRLHLTYGTYGTANSTYQTEVTDFSQVTAEGTEGNGPAYFTVQSADGITYQYGYVDANGNGVNSQVLAGSTVLTWLLSKVIDKAGNNYVINYTTLNGSVIGTAVPDKILWTPTASGASSYTYTMQFLYTNNVPQSSLDKYIGGAHVANPQLLSSIEILTGTTTVIKDYFLGYQASPVTGREQLTSLTECADSAQSNCLSPSVFTYVGGAPGVSTTASTALSSVGALVTARYDLNGDGYPDIVYEASDSSAWYVVFGSAGGYGSPVNIGINANVNGGVLIGRLNGGTQDGVLANNNGTWYYYSWNGAQFTGVSTGLAFDSTNSGYQLADINGDGLPDLVELNVTAKKVGAIATVTTRLNTSSGSSVSFSSSATTAYTSGVVAGAQLVTPDMQYSKLRRYDFNGDGQDDLVLLTITGSAAAGYSLNTNELVSNGSTFAISQIASIGASTYVPVAFANWNDDACTDFVTHGVLYVAACNGTAAKTFPISGTVLGTMDWDGDGRTDLIVANGSTIGVYLSTGSGVGGLTTTSVPYSSNCVYITMSAVGAGLDDLGCWSQTGPYSLTYYLHNGVPDFPSKFQDGYGNYAAPSYVLLSQSVGSVYFRQAPAPSYPYQEYTSPLYLVSTVNFNDPSSSTGTGTYSQSHTYTGATVDVLGRGFTGMQQHQMSDSRSGVSETWTYGVTFPYIGMLTQDVQIVNNTASDVIYSRTLSPASTTVSENSGGEVIFQWNSLDVVKNYEVGGPKNLQLIKTTSTSYSYDTWGNPTKVTTTVTDNDSGSPYYGDAWISATTNTPAVDTANWCLRLLTDTQVTYSVTPSSLGAPETLEKQFPSPDTPDCRYPSVVTQPGTNYAVTESFHYDSFGNIDTDTVTGLNMTPRVTSMNWGNTGQLPMSVTDPSSATTQVNYNFNFGVLSGVTDPNSTTQVPIITSWLYDSFGRKDKESRPDGTSTTWTYAICSGCDAQTRMVVGEIRRDASSNPISTVTYYDDMLDRLLYQTGTEINGTTTWVVQRGFDSLGRVTKESVPFVHGTVTPGNITYLYDVLNRVTSVSRPISASNSSPQSTNFTYEGRTTVVNDALQNSRTLVTDVNGWMRQTIDSYGYTVTTAYDAAGSRTGVTDSQGNTLWGPASYAYGIAPFLLGATDSDRGAWTYTYDALGEMTGWKDAKGQQFTATYDSLSRPLTRSEPDLFTQWTWGNTQSAHNIGKLQGVCTGTGTNPTSCTSSTGYSESETYDTQGRIYQRAIQIPAIASPTNGTYTYTYLYNTTTGLLDTLTYPISTNSCQLVVKYGYSYGLLASLTDASNSTQCGSTGTVFWAANSTDAMGHVTQATLGDGVVASRTYDAVTGLVQSIQATNGSGTVVQNQSYLFDKIGNLTQRQDNNLGLTESFYYDNVYRLDHSKLGSALNLQMGYSVAGNITSKSDVPGATWTYDPNHVHRLLTAGSNSYTYDNNGNAVTRNGGALTWSSYNYPSNIQSGSYSGTFYYGPDRQRFFQTVTDSSSTEQTTFVGHELELTFSPGQATMWRHYIYAGNEPVAIVYRESNGTNFSSYILKDHLGGVASVLIGSTPRVNESFAPFGLERNAADWSSALPTADAANVRYVGRRGFDFQTVIGQPGTTNALGLIHMNGRVEDVVTGRFLSADPNVPSPSDAQSYNRYSYVRNNPLTYIDPSGFEDCSADGDSGEQTMSCVEVNAGRDSAPSVGSGIIPDGVGGQGGMSTGGAAQGAGNQAPGVVPPSVCTRAGCLTYTQVCSDGLCQTAAFYYAFEAVAASLGISGPSGDNAERGAPTRPQENLDHGWSWAKIKSWLCTAGNSVADTADGLGNVSGKAELTGLGVAGAGVVTAQPEVTGAGLSLAAAGGAGNIGAGALQFTAGLMQGVGGGGYGNSGYAALSIVTGMILGRGILGPATSGYRTVSQRTADAFRNGTATVVGGVNDAYTSLIDAAAPQQVNCPGGN